MANGMLAAVGGAIAGVGAGLVDDAKAQRDKVLADTKYLQDLALTDRRGAIDLQNNLQVTNARGEQDRQTQSAKLPEGVMLDANGNRVADPAYVSAKSQIAQASQKEDGGKFQMMPGVGEDPNEPGKQTQGVYIFDVKTGETEFRAGVTLVGKGDASSGAIPAPKDTSQHGEPYLSTLSPADAAQVKALAEGRLAFPTGFAAKSARAQSLISAVSQYDPTFDAVNYQQRAAAVKAFATGKQGDTVRSLSVAAAHLDTLGQLADKLNNGDVQALNAVGNALNKQFGRAAPTNFEAAKEIVGDEVVKAVVGSGGAGALADREAIKKNISAASSPEQLRGQISTYLDLMRGQVSGLRQQYEQSTGRKNFGDLIAPEHRGAILPPVATDAPAQSASPSAPNAGPAQAGAPIPVSTQEQYDALPPNTRYTRPDGSIWTKQ